MAEYREQMASLVGGFCLVALAALTSGCMLGFEASEWSDAPPQDSSPNDVVDTLEVVFPTPEICSAGSCPSGCRVEWASESFSSTNGGKLVPVVLSYTVAGAPTSPLLGLSLVSATSAQATGSIATMGEGGESFEFEPSSVTTEEVDVRGVGKTGVVVGAYIPFVTERGVEAFNAVTRLDSTTSPRPDEVLAESSTPIGFDLFVSQPATGQSFVGFLVSDTDGTVRLGGARFRGGASPAIAPITEQRAVSDSARIVGSRVDQAGLLKVVVCDVGAPECKEIGFQNQDQTTLPWVEEHDMVAAREVLRLVDAHAGDIAITTQGAQVFLTADVFSSDAEDVPLAELDAPPQNADYVLSLSEGNESFIDFFVLDGDVTMVRVAPDLGLEPILPAERVPHSFPLPISDISATLVGRDRVVLAVRDSEGVVHIGERVCEAP